MPIAKYALNALGVAPAPPPKKRKRGVPLGGGYDPDEEAALFREFLDADKAFRSNLVAWELGADEYQPGQEISLSQFALRAHGESYERRNMLGEALDAIDAARVVIRREQAIRIAAYTTIVGGVAYISYRVVRLFLVRV